MFKPLLILSIMIVMQLNGLAQATTSDSSKVKASQLQNPKVEEVKVVEGIWAVSSYLGQKLADELSNRMNLGESKESPTKKPKKVTLVIGSFKVERMD